MKKKYRIKNKYRFSAFILTLLIIFATIILIRVQGNDQKPSKEVRVRRGDTLWSIASDNYDYKDQDIRQYIYELRKINNLESAELAINDKIKLPY